MERERESFSNRSEKRKILSENNVLSAPSACSFFRWRASSRRVRAAVQAGLQSGIVLK
jgi:hypothetical protein